MQTSKRDVAILKSPLIAVHAFLKSAESFSQDGGKAEKSQNTLMTSREVLCFSSHYVQSTVFQIFFEARIAEYLGKNLNWI